MHQKIAMRYTPILIIALLMGAAYFLELGDFFTFEQLKKHRASLKNFVANYPLLSPLSFILIYTAATALSIPAGAILSIAGGFLFAQPFSTLYVLIGATTGAVSIFFTAKTAVGDSLRTKAGPRLQKMHAGFEKNAASYLLFLRLVPTFPFWLVNLAPAFFGVRLHTFIWTTILGIMPGVFLFTQAGAGLESIFESGAEFSIQSTFTTDIKLALIGLAIFAMIPVLIKPFKRGK